MPETCQQCRGTRGFQKEDIRNNKTKQTINHQASGPLVDGGEVYDTILEGTLREGEENVAERENTGEEQREKEGNKPAPRELAEAFGTSMRQFFSNEQHT
jgi:hypothetical protein